MKRNDTILLTSGEIADWFVGADKTGLSELEAALKVRLSAVAPPAGLDGEPFPCLARLA